MGKRADTYRKRAAAFQRAAARNPAQKETFGNLAKVSQVAADVEENELPEPVKARAAQRLAPKPDEPSE